MRDGTRSTLAMAGMTLALLVVLALGSTSRFGRIASPTLMQPIQVVPPSSTPQPSAPPRPTIAPRPDAHPFVLPAWIGEAVLGLAALAVLVVIALVVARTMRQLNAKRGLEQADADQVVDADALPELVESVSESLADTLKRLRTGGRLDDVILECWRRLEEAAAATGTPRAASQTAEEFTVSVLAATPARPDDLRVLADLYRRAMFSTLPAAPDDRGRAVDALERLISSLGGERA
ncbi:MAG TPA: DUF4129 domain-containing protein [Propionibacteriaceae bacterium]|nr:DUF4129 domain-containing protein [Propionibacteriaceae bacterium]